MRLAIFALVGIFILNGCESVESANVLSDIEFQEKTRIKREKDRASALPILEARQATMEYGKEADKTRTYIKRNEKLFMYLGKGVVYYGSVLDRDRFEIFWTDLITQRDLLDLKDEDFNAFGVFLPKNVILEVLDFHKNNNDEFSLLVKQYPFAQVIFSQYLTIKLYEKHKEITKNPNLAYKDFLATNFTFAHNGRIYNIFEAIEKMRMRELNNKSDKFYSLISSFIAVADYEAITLYDFVYDIIPNSIRRVFLKNKDSMKAYLPLKQARFYYKEREYQNPQDMFREIYGEDKSFNAKQLKKEWYSFEALSVRDYTIQEPLIPKAKSTKLGIGYDELWELVSRSENDLDYPKIWEFSVVNAKEMQEYEIDEDRERVKVREKRKHILDYEFQSSWKDVIELNANFFPYATTYLEMYSGKMWIGDTAIITSDELKQIAANQYFDLKALVVRNNFHTEYAIFESTREEVKRGLALDNPSLHHNCKENCFGHSAFSINAHLAYRFNQALTLAFLNAYGER